ncbi:HalOD1 output domain-containing protein [Halobium salinum]
MMDPTDTRPTEKRTFHHEPDDGAHIGTSIAEAIAAVEGVDAGDAPSPLESVVDTDALDALFAPRNEDCTRGRGLVRFPFERHLVTVWADGTIVVEPDAVGG